MLVRRAREWLAPCGGGNLKYDSDFDRVLAHDDHLALRRARRAGDADGRCEILFRYEEVCDQCGRRTWQPHVAAGRTFCRRCCPGCAAAVQQMYRRAV
jgi:hypothetical protein